MLTSNLSTPKNNNIQSIDNFSKSIPLFGAKIVWLDGYRLEFRRDPSHLTVVHPSVTIYKDNKIISDDFNYAVQMLRKHKLIH